MYKADEYINTCTSRFPIFKFHGIDLTVYRQWTGNKNKKLTWAKNKSQALYLKSRFSWLISEWAAVIDLFPSHEFTLTNT